MGDFGEVGNVTNLSDAISFEIGDKQRLCTYNGNITFLRFITFSDELKCTK